MDEQGNREQRDSKGRFVKGMKRSEESKRRQAEALKAKYASGEIKAGMTGQTKEINPNVAKAGAKKVGKPTWTDGKKAKDYPKWQQAIQDAAAKRKAKGWKMPESGKKKLSDYWKAKSAECRERRKKQRFPRENSELEQLMHAAFEQLQLPFQKQARVPGVGGKHYYRVDIFINPNLVVECDGEYWHSRPWMITYDLRKDADLQKNGFLVVRLKESDIRTNPGILALEIRDKWLPLALLQANSNKANSGFGLTTTLHEEQTNGGNTNVK